MTITIGTEAFPLATRSANTAASPVRMRSVPTIPRRRSRRSTIVPERIPRASAGMRLAMPRSASACGPPPSVWNTSQVIAIAWNPSPITDPACASQSRRKSGIGRPRQPGGIKRSTERRAYCALACLRRARAPPFRAWTDSYDAEVKRVLLTGMSATGKSTVISELAVLGYKAVDTDYDGWSELVDDPASSGQSGLGREQDWLWREDASRASCLQKTRTCSSSAVAPRT